MANCIMVGCDLHDKSMLLKEAVDQGKPVTRHYATDAASRQRLIADLQALARHTGARRIVFAYEACGLGFGLCDELRAGGIECYVLAPTRMPRSPWQRKRKTDERDAQKILDYVRAFVLAGVELPAVWVPDRQTRDDRELVRRRLALGEDVTVVKTRMRWLLKRTGIEGAPAAAWTERYRQWLDELVAGRLEAGAAAALSSLKRQLEWLEGETLRLNQQVRALAEQARYAPAVAAIRRCNLGVGVLTAMVFLTEMGDLSRFQNRRQVGSFLGLAPSSHETGETDNRKGHITHQGPARVRKVLCQAVWSRLRFDAAEAAAYQRLVAKNPQHKKIAVVARMRVLGVRMWHSGLAVARAAPGSAPPVAPGGRTPAAEAVPSRSRPRGWAAPAPEVSMH